MDRHTYNRIIELWIKSKYIGEQPYNLASDPDADPDDDDPTLWAVAELDELISDEPEIAWSLILDILKKDSTDLILGRLSIGPLEDLLIRHGEDFIDRVEEEARKNSKFRYMMKGLWKMDPISDNIWQRIQAAREGN